MRMIIAIVQPTKLNVVRDALKRIGVERMTVLDGQGYGRQRGQKGTFRNIEYKTDLLYKVVLEILVNEDFLERTLETLTHAARTGSEGQIGDGKIFVVPCERTIDLATGNAGPGAV
jgi:nitrogen regulatory protein PII